MRLIDADKLRKILMDYFQINGDCYTYSLTRCKKAFDVGTMSLDDFKEFDEEMIDDIVEYILENELTVEEVTGEWVDNYCSVCGAPIPTDSVVDYIGIDENIYCYICGSKNREVE